MSSSMETDEGVEQLEDFILEDGDEGETLVINKEITEKLKWDLR